jgi:hypothetical protein
MDLTKTARRNAKVLLGAGCTATGLCIAGLVAKYAFGVNIPEEVLILLLVVGYPAALGGIFSYFVATSDK